MKFTDNMRNYLPLPVPIDKPFADLSKKEAKDYFAWFVSHLDERCGYLRGKVSSGLGIPANRVDYSLDSLKLVWKWFLQVAEVSKTPKDVLRALEKSMAGQPKSFIEHMIKQSSEELSVFTEYVLRDIGMYIGKLFLTNYPCLRWTIKHTPKSYVHVNVPLIVGFVDDDESYPEPFHPEMEPIDLARTPAMNLFAKTQKEDDLFDWCMKWVQWIPENKGEE